MPKKRKLKQKAKEIDVSPHIFTSEDKTFSREPYEEHPLSPRPDSIICLMSPPGHGKTSIVKNWACHTDVRKVFVAHGAGIGEDGKLATREYDLCDYEAVDFETHGPDYYISESKKIKGGGMLLICDDLPYADFSKKARQNIYRCVQLVCTHYQMVMMMTAHSWPQLVPRLRRLCTIYCLWKPSADQIPYLASGLGCSRDMLNRAFAKCKTKYDFIVIERDCPPFRAPWRLNGYLPLRMD